MTVEMLKETIAQGFPLEIVMADGRTVPVPHQDYISVSPNGDYVVAFGEKGEFYLLKGLTEEESIESLKASIELLNQDSLEHSEDTEKLVVA